MNPRKKTMNKPKQSGSMSRSELDWHITIFAIGVIFLVVHFTS